MNPQSMSKETNVEVIIGATSADPGSLTSVALLEELLTESIRLRDLYKNARLQIPSGQYRELRRIVDHHYKQQFGIIDLIVDRIRALGGAVGLFASEFLQSGQYCRVLRGPQALNRLLHDFLEAHESLLSMARLHCSNDATYWVRDFAVGQVVLANERQSELISEILLRSDPQQRLQTDVQ